MIVLESNQNHATAKETEICTTLPASMGMGGGYVPMIVIGIDFYNQTMTGEISKCMNSIRSDSDHTPCVLVEVEDGSNTSGQSSKRQPSDHS